MNIDAAVYYRGSGIGCLISVVIDAPKSVYAVQNIHSAVKELSYATLRGLGGDGIARKRNRGTVYASELA